MNCTGSRDIYLRDLHMYATNQSYLGEEVHEVHINVPANISFSVQCIEGQVPTVPFSVEINGEFGPLT